MPAARDVVVVSAVRTAIADYGGSLKTQSPTDLAVAVSREAINRSGLPAQNIGACVFANVIHTEAKDMYLARVAALNAGMGHTSQAFTLNRLCGSGLQSIISAAQQIMLGDVDSAIAGGAESMSRSGYNFPNARWGQRMGDGVFIDMMTGALTDPFGSYHMGITAENIAQRWKINRIEQDQLALLSHQRAANAIARGYFTDQIMPYTFNQKGKTVTVVRDEHVRSDLQLEEISQLRPVFKTDGTVTAGNASGINDAAAAVVLMERQAAARLQIEPIMRLVGYSVAGVDPQIMGIGPVPAIQDVCKRTGLSLADIDIIELNEAFAVQAIACIRDLQLPIEKVNPNGSGISLGHPIGATGTILTVKLAYELDRIDGQFGLVSMCIGGGQGIAAIFERQ